MQIFCVFLHTGIHIGIDLTPRQEFIGGVNGELFKFRPDCFQITLRGYGFFPPLREICTDGAVIFGGGEFAEVAHASQDAVACAQADFRVDEGGVVVRGADDGRKHRAFCGGEVFCVLAEVKFGGAGDAVARVPEIDRIQVHFQDLIFRVPLFELSGEFYFAEFSYKRFFARQLRVFDELLADRGAALPERSCPQVCEHGARDAFVIQSAVIVKIFVFGTDKGISDIRGQVGAFDAFMPSARGKFGDERVRCVINCVPFCRGGQLFGLQARIRRYGNIKDGSCRGQRDERYERCGGDLCKNFHGVPLPYSIP